MASIASICTKENRVRSNYYSDTYRAEFTISDVKHMWDVQHISIPFSTEKELAFKARFNLSDADMADFYTKFRNNLRHSMKVQNKLKAANDEAVDKATFYSYKLIANKKSTGDGNDIYIISEVSEPLVGSQIIKDSGANLHMILNLGLRLLQTVKIYNDRGLCLGVAELSSINVVHNDDKAIIKNPFFLFADDGEEYPELTIDAKNYLPTDVFSGKEKISGSSDIYAVCVILWNLLSGKHYSEVPDLSTYPQYVPQEFSDMLLRGMKEGVAVRKDLSLAVRNATKSFPDGFIKFEEPSYLQREQAALAEYLKYSVQEESDPDDEDYYDDEDDNAEITDAEAELEPQETFLDHMSKKQQMGISISAGLLSAVLIAGSFFGGKMLGEYGWRAVSPKQEIQEEEIVDIEDPQATEKPKPTPLPFPQSKSLSSSEIPTLNLDRDYDWFKSEYPAEDFCAVLFTDSFPIDDEIIESWNFALNDTSVMCYVYPRPKGATKVLCNTNGGDKILVISGNGCGALNVKMTQTELAQYFLYKFTYGNLNGLSCLRSVGSTPFIPPTPEPTEAPKSGVIEEFPEKDPETENVPNQQPPKQTDIQNNQTQNGGYTQNNYNNNSYNNGWSDPGYNQVQYEQQTEVTTTVTQTEDWADSGMNVRQYSITASNDHVAVGQSITLRIDGDPGQIYSVYASDPNILIVAGYPDANGYYQITGRLPGICLVSVDSEVGLASVSVECR